MRHTNKQRKKYKKKNRSFDMTSFHTQFMNDELCERKELERNEVERVMYLFFKSRHG